MAGNLPPSLEFPGRIVHVWPVRTAASKDVISRLERVLAPDERDRAARFRLGHLRDSFVVARGALRIMLGRYLNTSAAGIQFHYGSKGKPALAASSPLHFNASHSGGLAVFAFTAGCEIGVDVEQIRPLPDMQNVAARFFCREEAAELMSLTAGQREHAFFLCWTRKEAYIKATGDGLSAPLDDFRVTLQPGQPARFIHIAHDVNAAKEWSLSNIELAPDELAPDELAPDELAPDDLAPDYAAALAYRDAERPVVVFPAMYPAELASITSSL